MKHHIFTTEAAMSNACDDYTEHELCNWVDGDEQIVTVYFSISRADHDDCLPSVTVIGAATNDGEIYDRAGFAALIGEKFVAMIEYGKAEEWA